MRTRRRENLGRIRPRLSLPILGLLVLAAAQPLHAQLESASAQGSASAAPTFASTPAPAALPAGFSSPDGEDALRRFEVIAFGAFPIMLFYADFGIDLSLFAINGFDMSYAPWPFKSELSVVPTEGERLFRLGVAAGASIAVAVADIIIRTLKQRSAQRRAAASISQPEADSGAAAPSGTPP